MTTVNFTLNSGYASPRKLNSRKSAKKVSAIQVKRVDYEEFLNKIYPNEKKENLAVSLNKNQNVNKK